MLKKLFLIFLLLPVTIYGQRLSLDRGWSFHLGDIPFPVVKGHSESYLNAKAGHAQGAAAPGYDDSQWQKVNLPHDWAIGTPVDSTENLAQGYHHRGMGWYRRQFKLETADRGQYLELQFDGVATHCTVWVNGILIHRNWNGYTSFYIDMTAIARYGDELNTVAVQVNADDQEGWWYEGAGIYRHTWLVRRPPLHVITDGVYAQPVKKNGQHWLIPAEVSLENSGQVSTAAVIEMEVHDTKGKMIAAGRTDAFAEMLKLTTVKLELAVDHPRLWSPDTPVLYRVTTYVRSANGQTDSSETRCGFRSIQFRADSGFYLNGKRTEIRGICNHQDLPGVGVAVPDALWSFRLHKLKEMGANAYRCAHNPPSAEFLDACDRLGMLVMDENRHFNAAPEYLRQLAWMVRRDRNHPSVILWSVFNEEPMQGSETGYQMVRRLSATVKQLDTIRPVTAAMNGGFFSPVNVAQAVDVAGFNYQIDKYDAFHHAHPGLPLTSSEDASGLMMRGVYETDFTRHLLDAYDTQKPGWGATHREAWKAIEKRPYLAGCFVWTGFDYHGEPTPFEWPTTGSSFGIMDACGFPKTAFYIHQAQWRKDRHVLAIAPHWNWPVSMTGKPIKVLVITNADRIELRLNGMLIGSQWADQYEMNQWNVPYHPGKLEARAYRDGKLIATQVVQTTGRAVALQLIPDRDCLSGDGLDAMPVTVRAVDSKGNVVPDAQLAVSFALTGQGTIIGLGNGDPNSHEPEQGTKRSLFNGLAQVLLQTRTNSSGYLLLRAASPGLKPAALTIPLALAAAARLVPEISPVQALAEWLLSPMTASRPNPGQQVAPNDMNSWERIHLPAGRTFSSGGYIILRAAFTVNASIQKNGGNMLLPGVSGEAEVWLDGKLAATKDQSEAADIRLKLRPGKADRLVNLLVKVHGAAMFGPAAPAVIR